MSPPMSYMRSKLSRTVEIVRDPNDPRPWVAIDRRTGEPVLRLFNRDQLEQVCLRFGWRIVASKAPA
jgi:hypothetical protein